MNQTEHTSTGQQPYFAFFSRHPPRLVSATLPSVDGGDEDLVEVHALIRSTHLRMSRHYRHFANRRRVNQAVDVGSLVWVRRETAMPGTCRKLNPRSDGIYRVVEKLLGGSVYVMESLFTEKKVQRAAGQS